MGGVGLTGSSTSGRGDRALTDAREAAIAELTLHEKVLLLTGATTWRTQELPSIGLGAITFSDGPIGVRGTGETPGETALAFPNPSAVAATWDLSLVERLGTLHASEARSKGVDVVLAPLLNLQRTPVAGRHFESYSEDPVLTGSIAAAQVRAIQREGIGTCLKHFICNESETERTTYLSEVDGRTLREVYLEPFARVIDEADPWCVMAAYNGIDVDGVSASATEHVHLLQDVLRGELGFDGAVISDWLATKTTEPSALAGLDLVMPGPSGPWAETLEDAVLAGRVPESVIDDKVRHLLDLAIRVGAWPKQPAAPTPPASAPGSIELLTEVAARACVVLKGGDDGHWAPISPDQLRSVALIGPAAVEPLIQGGGSAFIVPDAVSMPADALRSALPAEVGLSVHRGGRAAAFAPELELATVATDPLTGHPGLRLRLLDQAGAELDSWLVLDGWDGRPGLDDRDPRGHTLEISADLHLAAPGTHQLGVGTVGAYRITFDDSIVAQGLHRAGSEVILNSSVNNPADVSVEVEVVSPVTVGLVAAVQVIDAPGYGRFARAAIRHQPPHIGADAELAEAVAAAKAADVAIVMVGTTATEESEGWDRADLELPGRQNDLVRAVAAVNPRTIVIVNAGAPVLLPWLDERPDQVLWCWLPGQQMGAALAAVLTGQIEPSGRLPWTLPARAGDVPVPHAIPQAGIVTYREGADVGYRGWQRLGRVPARPFGFGLGWSTWSFDHADAQLHPDGNLTVEVALTNLGPRRSTQTVQVYLDEPGETRRLAGFAAATADPGAQVQVAVDVPARYARHYLDGRWVPSAQPLTLAIGSDVATTSLSIPWPGSPVQPTAQSQSVVS